MSYFSLSLWNMQLNCGFFGFLLFFCRLKILCVWICCVVSRIKSHLYICALHISIVAVSPLSCDAAEDTLLCCPHNKVEKEKLGYFTLKTLCMESTHNGVVFSWDSLRSLSSLSFEFSLFFLESFFFLTPVMFFFFMPPDESSHFQSCPSVFPSVCPSVLFL